MPDSQSAEYRRLQTIFQHSNDAILFVDIAHDRILDANPRASEMLGYSARELRQVRVSDIHPEEMQELRQFADRVAADGSGWTDRLTCITKHRSTIEAEISASVVEFDGRACFVALIRDISERERLKRENRYYRQQSEIESGFGDIVGQSPALHKTLEQVELVAGTDATVLIHGETGTGKELIAQAIHARSHRASRPLVKVNCPSIPDELFESEFFGHVRGAFTGAAQDRVGRFGLAEGGTLFLDEIADIPSALQAKLLRVLQENQYERVGESRSRHTDVRIIAATNRDLLAESRAGRFRSDLYYRLSVFPVEVPPLRERPEDIAPLARYFIARLCAKYGHPEPTLSATEVSLLEAQEWPGNIRELQNVLERAVIRAAGRPLQLAELLTHPHAPPAGAPSSPPLAGVGAMPLTELRAREKQIILDALERSGGKVYGPEGAASLLGIAPTTLSYRIRKHGIR